MRAPEHSILGLILAGGASQRMGADKAELMLAGETLLARAVAALRALVAEILVAARPGQMLPSLPPGVAVVRDEIAGQGPLRGLVEGLRCAHGRFAAVLVIPVDSAQPGRPLLGELAARIQRGEVMAVVPKVDNRVLPLPGAYRTDLLPIAERLLAGAGKHGLLDLLAQTHPAYMAITAAEAAGWSLNTPSEYARALRGELEV